MSLSFNKGQLHLLKVGIIYWRLVLLIEGQWHLLKVSHIYWKSVVFIESPWLLLKVYDPSSNAFVTP